MSFSSSGHDLFCFLSEALNLAPYWRVYTHLSLSLVSDGKDSHTSDVRSCLSCNFQFWEKAQFRRWSFLFESKVLAGGTMLGSRHFQNQQRRRHILVPEQGLSRGPSCSTPAISHVQKKVFVKKREKIVK